MIEYGYLHITDIKLLFVDVIEEQQEKNDVVSSRPTFPSPPLVNALKFWLEPLQNLFGPES